MYFRICPVCGAHLDPGESCECEKVPEDPEAEAERKRKADRRKLRIEQLRIDFAVTACQDDPRIRALQDPDVWDNPLNAVITTEKTA